MSEHVCKYIVLYWIAFEMQLAEDTYQPCGVLMYLHLIRRTVHDVYELLPVCDAMCPGMAAV